MVIKSWSSDVVPGSEGVIIKRMPGGYALRVTGYFSDAVGDRRIETRCLFFRYEELRKAQPPKAEAPSRSLRESSASAPKF